MGSYVSRDDFEWVYTDQPHADRRKEILVAEKTSTKSTGHCRSGPNPLGRAPTAAKMGNRILTLQPDSCSPKTLPPISSEADTEERTVPHFLIISKRLECSVQASHNPKGHRGAYFLQKLPIV